LLFLWEMSLELIIAASGSRLPDPRSPRPRRFAGEAFARTAFRGRQGGAIIVVSHGGASANRRASAPFR
jgi:hypothetical protein